jgi:hypothetical protein
MSHRRGLLVERIADVGRLVRSDRGRIIRSVRVERDVARRPLQRELRLGQQAVAMLVPVKWTP